MGPLRAFGAAADTPHGPNVRIEEGGYIIPGRVPVPTAAPGKESCPYGIPQEAGLDEARTGPGLRKGRRARRAFKTGVSAGETLAAPGEADPTTGDTCSTAIKTGSPPQTLGRRLNEALRLEELELWYPSSKIVRCSSGLALLSIDVGVIRSLPYRGRLLLEIPLRDLPDPHRHPEPPSSSFVPEVRAWAHWQDGVRPTGDHVYPDASLCTYTRGEWIWGSDPLHELVDYCTCWLAKISHLKYLGRWPGRQHCSANVAMRRQMLDEFCRCGGPERYRNCHFPSDRQRSPYELFREEQAGASWYLWEVRRRGWHTTPPWVR